MYNYQPNPYFNYMGMQQQQVQSPTLNGKIVDSIEVAKSQEIPFASYGIFPKADMSEIFVKAWNNDGTTRIDEYVLKSKQTGSETNYFDEILNQIKLIEKKIDSKQSSTTRKKKVEVDEDDDE